MTLGADDLVLCAGTLPRETPWSERLAAASSAGFAGMSVWGRDYAAARRDGWTDADLRAQLDDHGLAVAELDPAWDVVRRADRPNGGLALDAWHWFRSGTPSDVATLGGIPGTKVFGVQLDDAPAEPEANLMSATLHHRRLPGEGAIDLAALIDALHEIGTAAPIGVEVFSDALHALGPMEAAERAADATRSVLARTS
jgi:sugar phosphate isomerase/epimerase